MRVTPFVTLIVVACASAASIACEGGAAPRHARADGPVRDILDRRLAAAVADTSAASRALCRNEGQLLWMFDVPHGPSSGATGCRLQVGDTILYAYRDSAGRALVAGWLVSYRAEHIGVEVRTDSARVRRSADSVRATLERRYGASAHCPDSSDFATSDGGEYRWDIGDSAGILLWWNPGSTTAWLSVEAHQRAITCRSVAGAPHSH